MGEWTKLHKAIVESAAIVGYVEGFLHSAIMQDGFTIEWKERAELVLKDTKEKQDMVQRLVREHITLQREKK